MRLIWHGHACFRIAPERGPTIVTDPYDPDTSGYRPLREPADVVVRSSPDDDFHNNAHLVPGHPRVVEALHLARKAMTQTIDGVTFSAVPAEEGKPGVQDQDANAMYRFAVDGVEIAHMGDAGRPVSDAQATFLTGTDVLLALAGGPPTIPLHALREAVDRLRPRLVVPMHFRTLRLKLTGTAWITEFLHAMGGYPVDFAFHESATITRTSLPERTRVLVLDHA